MRLLLVTLMALTGCARLPLVRDCGAVVGDHSGAQDFSWVQPCHRDDRDGCEGRCRRARTACEADRAAFRDKRLWWQGPGGVTEAEASRNLRLIDERMAIDCH